MKYQGITSEARRRIEGESSSVSASSEEAMNLQWGN